LAGFINCPSGDALSMALASVLQFAKLLIEERVRPGEAVIDATVGKGNDTLFLAQLTGPHGRVFGFDIQAEAIAFAQKKIRDQLLSNDTIQWIFRSHEFMLEEIDIAWHGQIGAVMFNLGYLPGFDHDITTTIRATITGLDAAIRLLRTGGLITIVAYTGHIGGREEADAVEQWVSQLPQSQFNVLSYRFINQKNNPPFLVAVEKKG
jgi:SAM-dependent methyltransferase